MFFFIISFYSSINSVEKFNRAAQAAINSHVQIQRKKNRILMNEVPSF